MRVVSASGNQPTFGPEYKFTLMADGQVISDGAFGSEIVLARETLGDFIKETDLDLRNFGNDEASSTSTETTKNFWQRLMSLFGNN